MTWSCRDCPTGVLCGDPPPPCPHDLPVTELAKNGWVKAGCYCIEILVHPETGAVWLRRTECGECGEEETN